MSLNISIAQLARSLGRSTAEVLDTLRALGYSGFQSKRQRISLDLASEVRQRFAPPVGADTSAPPDEDVRLVLLDGPEDTSLFEQAMDMAGVEPLTRRSRQPAQAVSRKKRSTRFRKQDATPSPVLPAESPPPPPPEPPPADPVVVTEVVDGVKEMAAEMAALQDERKSMKERIKYLLAEKDKTEKALAGLQRRMDARDELRSSGAHSGLVEEFAARGVRGLDEVSLALRGLLRQHAFDGILPLLDITRPEKFAAVLEERLCLVCGRDGCEPPSGSTAVRVPAERCELCAGETAARVFRIFNSACLLSGVTRVLLVGGAPQFQRWIKEGVDRRIALRLIPGSGPLGGERVASDARWAQVIVLWALRAMERRTMEAFSAAPAPVIRIHQWAAGACLLEAAEGIEALDVSLFPATQRPAPAPNPFPEI